MEDERGGDDSEGEVSEEKTMLDTHLPTPIKRRTSKNLLYQPTHRWSEATFGHFNENVSLKLLNLTPEQHF